MRLFLFMFSLLSIFSCKTDSLEKADEKAQYIVDRAIERHGGDRYEELKVQYVFRNRAYSIENEGNQYTYTRSFEQDGKQIQDILKDDGYERKIDGKLVSVPDSMIVRYSNSVNSVNYFAQLPYHLNDAAVNKTYEAETVIKGKKYEVVKVTFDQDGGGDDFDDIYYYWFDAETYTLDYLAYSFYVDGGGIRFREAYNQRDINGIRFQDYVNYKAAKDVNLASLPKLFEEGKLQKLSRIEMKDVKLMK